MSFRHYVLSLVAVLAVSVAGTAFAAEAEKAATEGATPNVPVVLPVASPELGWSLEMRHPGVAMKISVMYPQGFGKEADAALAQFAKKEFDEAFTPFLEYSAGKAKEVQAAISEDLAAGKAWKVEKSVEWFSNTSYNVFNSSPRYASVVFAEEEYTGGAHGNRMFAVFSFDKQSGKQLGMSDMFADWAKAESALVAAVTTAVQSKKAKNADPVKTDARTADLRPSRIALTPEGMKVYYAPYEMGAYAEGSFIIDLPKADLVKMGANAALWQ